MISLKAKLFSSCRTAVTKTPDIAELNNFFKVTWSYFDGLINVCQIIL